MKLFKKIAVALAMIVFAASFVIPAAADEELPYDLVAPENVAVNWFEEADSPTTMKLTYSLTPEMNQFFEALDSAEDRGAFLADYGWEDIAAGAQIDWAIDDVKDPVSGWHYNKYWDGNSNGDFGKDDEYQDRVGWWDLVDLWYNDPHGTVQDPWIMRGINEDDWYGNPELTIPALKDQLNPDQAYWDGENVRIDFTKHTAYFRVRFFLKTFKTVGDEYRATVYFSEWSETVGYGKDIAAYEPLKPGSVPKPVISGLRMTDEEFNDNPVAAYTLEVPAEVQKMATESEAHGGAFWIETSVRVKGDAEWTDVTEADRTIRAGERRVYLLYLAKEDEVIPKDTEIELKCRYYVEEVGQDAFYSDWSDIITFGTEEISNPTGAPVDGTAPDDTETIGISDPGKPNDCPICHFCSQPLGLCIFIWIAIILLILIIIIVIVVIAKKNKKKKEQNK